MNENARNHDDEIQDLKDELEKFKQEKERVRAIVGKIGGVPAAQTKIINIVFAVLIAAFLLVSIAGGEKLRPLMLELTIVALSVKIVFLIHLQSRVNHFQLWVMSAIEWRMNEMMKIVKSLAKNM
ncbi:MAG: hypothetical protein DRP66_09435 [Planctomycetota bacterium]|nr:MAG: hypothetical protein DRP66_09435 [Planctomycetota bacterium]